MLTHALMAATTILCANIAAHAPQAATGPAAQPAENYPVIVSIVGRHQTVVIQSSSKGPVYTVKGEDGKVLVDRATAADLEAGHPELYRQIRGYKADAGQWWAGIDASSR